MNQEVPRLTSGCEAFDCALGGGLPRGRIIELYGPEGPAKRALAYALVAAEQRSGGCAAWLNLDNFERSAARRAGVDLAALLVGESATPTSPIAVALTYARLGGTRLVVVDGVTSILDAPDDLTRQLRARVFSQALRSLCAQVHHNGVTVVFLHDQRARVRAAFGQPPPPPATALRFYASVRAEVRGDTGCMTVRVVKNKDAPPFRSARLSVRDGQLHESEAD